MNEERLQELIEEATVDCYGEEEEFWGFLSALGDELSFPIQATLIGEPVELIGLDDEASTSHRGIVARIRRRGQEYSVSLADLTIPESDTHHAEWLAAYRYWLQSF